MIKFVLFTKRTEDPKLSYLEWRLTQAGIPHRRNGESFHAPIMEVDEARFDDAEDILLEKRGKVCLDEIEDDAAEFHGFEPHDFIPSEEVDHAASQVRTDSDSDRS